jgi:hypothetical protein
VKDGGTRRITVLNEFRMMLSRGSDEHDQDTAFVLGKASCVETDCVPWYLVTRLGALQLHEWKAFRLAE